MGARQSIFKFETPKQVVAGIVSDGVNYGIPFFELELPVNGHNYRFRGITGGYTDGVNYFDVNGVVTTRTLAFPENLCCDLSTLDKDGNFIMFLMDLTFSNLGYVSAITTAQAVSTTSFTSGFDLITLPMANKLLFGSQTFFLAFKPFESVSGVWVWTRTDLGSLTTSFTMRANQSTTTLSKVSAASARPLAYRVTNISEIN